MSSNRSLFALVALASAACGGSGPAASFTARDSAGIRLVTYAHVPDSASSELGPAPVLSLGAANGDEAVTFQRIADVVPFPDGAVYVADGVTQEIRGFSATGEHLVTFGRRGRGPGEFSVLKNLFLLGGDSIVGTDAFTGTAQIFDRSGHLSRSFTPAPGMDPGFQRAFLAGITDGGSMVLVGSSDQAREGGDDAGYRRFRLRVWLRAPGADSAVAMGTFPGFEMELESWHGRPTMMARIMGGDTKVAAGGPTVAVATTDQAEVRLYRGATLATVVRMGGTRRPVDGAARARALEHRLSFATTDDQRADIRRLFRDKAFPDSMPAFGSLLVDGAGRAWVQRYAADYEAGPTLWWVLDTDGTLDGIVSMPPGFTPKRITSGRVAGVWKDEMDVEYVRAYAY